MSNPIARIGQTDFRNRHVPFGIKQRDRLFHMLAVGKTGSGKSTVLQSMMRSDIEAGAGFALLDGHGDLAEQVLAMVPTRRLGDVVYVNPALPEFAPAINLLAGSNQHLAVSEFISIFRHLWPEFWGPRTEYLLRQALLLLVTSVSGAALADVARVFTLPYFRKPLVSALAPGALREFWEREFEDYSKHFRTEATAPILNKLGAITGNPVLTRIFGRRSSEIDFRRLVDSGGVLVANLSKGSVGEDASSLLGSVILSKLVLAGLSRSDLPEEKRRFFGIYADEAQQFLTESTLSLFSELRKYGIGGTWAVQYLGGLPEPLRRAVLGNVGTVLAFALSGEDAEALATDFGPEVRTQDLIDLPPHRFYVKLRIDAVTSRPFSAKTVPVTSSRRSDPHGEIRSSPSDSAPGGLHPQRDRDEPGNSLQERLF